MFHLLVFKIPTKIKKQNDWKHKIFLFYNKYKIPRLFSYLSLSSLTVSFTFSWWNYSYFLRVVHSSVTEHTYTNIKCKIWLKQWTNNKKSNEVKLYKYSNQTVNQANSSGQYSQLCSYFIFYHTKKKLELNCKHELALLSWIGWNFIAFEWFSFESLWQLIHKIFLCNTTLFV